MIVVLKNESTEEDITYIEKKLISFGVSTKVVRGQFKTLIGVIGDTTRVNESQIKAIESVEEVLHVLKPYKFASRESHKEDSVIDIDGVKIGGGNFTVIAGPCAIESEDQYLTAARALKKLGVQVLRGSIFKPRTSPYDFQGLREDGLELFAKAKKETGMVIETEIMDVRQVKLVEDYVDILRVGARNMQNYDLLREVGRQNKPVILKRGLSATIQEFLLAAEYIMSEGNHQVILCERGIRTFETATRNTLDISAVPVVKDESHLPIVIDPSHSTGNRNWVLPIARAALAVGADGVIVEAHPDPESALCDGMQSITMEQSAEMISQLRELAKPLGKNLT